MHLSFSCNGTHKVVILMDSWQSLNEQQHFEPKIKPATYVAGLQFLVQVGD